MRVWSRVSVLLLFIGSALTLRSLAAINVPTDGSDGNFNPSADIVVDLSQASSMARGMPTIAPMPARASMTVPSGPWSSRTTLS